MGLAARPGLFLFGTLRDPELLQHVAGGSVRVVPASLLGHRVARADGQSFPVLVLADGSRAEGLLLVAPTPEQIARIDFYEAPYGYHRVACTLISDGASIEAEVYRPSAAQWPPAEDWSLSDWQTAHGPLMREAAVEIMEEMGRSEPADIANRFQVIRTRAQQRLNARASFSPVQLRQEHGVADVEVTAKITAYSHFFKLDELSVRARRFDGEMSEPMERAVFLAADAVTVLPYDPVRDTVMLIEQFRPGCFLRGDPNPWSLEAIAGRQDPGETLEETARREAIEEARVTLGRLHRANSYYSSPGTNTEYLTSYIGIADLPDTAAGFGGLESEAEDIRSMVVPFARLMEAVEGGEAENGPLLISAYWLAAHRDRLRAGS
ncbi:MAG: gamma-glutamylcyclotransferase [Pseudomonadota bacterium]